MEGFGNWKPEKYNVRWSDLKKNRSLQENNKNSFSDKRAINKWKQTSKLNWSKHDSLLCFHTFFDCFLKLRHQYVDHSVYHSHFQIT